MAADEHRDDPRAELGAATARDGDAELETPAHDSPAPALEPDDEPALEPDVEPGEGDELEPDAELETDDHTCPMCEGKGTLPFDPPQDQRAERCADCDGLGTVYTGSLVEEAYFRPCGTCGGKGFNERASVTPIAAPPYQVVPASTPTTDKLYYDPADVNTWHLPPAPGTTLVPTGG